ncbi:Sugar lactone lactonase YvrE [Prosthecobacter debontii]|uniref:Sugar lactone lactonase YvrE n=2 Tax=Prosthecobacter debontii TaxID=48467 RepID=A0A1T4WF63_9BACT|nr:Sugar lactone lactonase YvrE [Prosthecobacter debontii]
MAIGSLMLSFRKQAGAWMILCIVACLPQPEASAAPSAFGPPDGQGVFDITATVPPGHGTGFFEMSTDANFGLEVTTKAGVPETSGLADGAAALAKFSNPAAVAKDASGNLFIADSGNNCIRMVSPSGVVSTIAGSSIYGFVDGLGSVSRFAFPCGVAVGPDDNVYVSDTNNTCIRKLIRPAVEGGAWMVTTLAGTNSSGFFDGSGSAARFSSPQGLVVAADGSIFVADAGNHRIRKVTSGGSVTTYAGTGSGGAFADGAAASEARFNSPYGVVLDSAGNLFVADRLNHRIRKVTPGGIVSTYAGSGSAGSADGTLLAATFNGPVALAIDAFDTLYVSDENNHKVRRVSPAGGPDEVTSVAGSGVEGFTNDRAELAEFNFPAGLVVADTGDIILADSENHCLRKITATVAVAAVGNPTVPEVKATINPAALGIPPGTYYFRWRAGDWTAQNEGLNKYITTVVPGVVTAAANPVNAGEATLNAKVNPRGLPVTQVKFQYTTDEDFLAPLEASGSPLPGSGSADEDVSYVLSYPTNTLPGTVYYFRAVAINDYGTAVATDILSFTVPTTKVVTEAATNIIRTGLLSHEATLNATIDPKGSAMTVSFEYSTEPLLFDAWQVSTAIPSPNASGARGLAVDSTGHAYYSRRELHRIDQSPSGPSIGSGAAGFVNGDFTTAQFDNPTAVALYNPDVATKILYVADEFNHCVRKVDLINGTVTTYAGSGIAGYVDGAAASARFLYPSGVAVDAAGNVYVSDTGNHRIRKISVGTDTVVTIAGTGVAGLTDGPGVAAQLRSPTALTAAPDGTLYVADTGNHRICKITTGYDVTGIAGDGTAGFADDTDSDPTTYSRFSSPSGITLDSAGVLFVADRGNHRVRRIAVDGTVTTIAGSGIEGKIDSPTTGTGLIPAKATRFSSPTALGVDGSGNVFVTEEGSNQDVRKISPIPVTTVTVTPDLIAHGDQAASKATLVLSPGTTYYYRAVGDNRLDGVIQGEIESFTTYTEPAINVYDGATTSAPVLSQPQTTTIDFGIMAIATDTVRQFTISNDGGWPLTVSSIDVPAGYTYTGTISVIPPGESRTFSVTITAASAGIYSGNVVVSCDDPTRLSFVFPITGKKVNPPIIHSVELQNLTLTPTGATLVADVDPNGAETTFEFEVSPGPDFEGVRVTTTAGSTSGYADGTGVAAQFNNPKGLVADADGNVYIADTANHRIRKMTPEGVVSTVAGTGDAGFGNGPALAAQFNEPMGLALGSDGTIYVADSKNHRIRAISSGGTVTTYSGTGEASFTDGVRDAARFYHPVGLAMDAAGILYVADRDNHRIRKVASDGSVSTLAILDPASTPTGITVSGDGSVYVTDTAEHVVYKITSIGAVTILADLGTGIPAGIVVDDAYEKIFVADQAAHIVHKITLDGTVATWAGTGVQGTVDNLGTSARFDTPYALALLKSRHVAVGQLGNSLLRQITPTVIKVPAASVLTDPGGIVSLEVTGLDPGIIYYYRAIAVSVGGRTISSTPHLPVGTEFTLWQIDHFGDDAADPSIAGPGANPTGDHVSNLLKYALGLDPNVYLQPNDPRLPTVGYDTTAPGYLTLTVHPDPAVTNVRLFFESSADKVNWFESDVITTTDISGNLKGALPYALPQNPPPKRFLRLGVQLLLP